MKTSVIFLFIFLYSTLGFSQSEVGQTKAYIIKKNENCYIGGNLLGELIIFDCDGYTRFYGFDDLGLCDVMGFELGKSFRGEYINSLKANGFKLIRKDDTPIILSLKNKEVPTYKTSPSLIFENEFYKITVLEYNLAGQKYSDVFGVYAEFP